MKVVPGAELLRSDGFEFDLLEGGAVRSRQGNDGQVLYGPYVSLAGGIYRVLVRARVEDEGAAPAYVELFDAQNEWRVFASRYFRGGVEVFVRLYETRHLEVRFRTSGSAFVVDAIEIEPLLLDTELASPEQVRALAERLIAVQAEPNAVFRALDRLADWNEAGTAEALRTRFIEGRGGTAARARALAVEMHTPGWADRPLVETEPLDRQQIWDAIWPQEIARKDMIGATVDTAAELRQLGYEPAYLDATRFHRDYDEPRRSWHERPAETGRVGDFPYRQPLFEHHSAIDRSFQASLARGDGVTAYCPVSGRRLRSRHGFLLHFMDLPFLMYRFEGVEVFYLGVGHISGMKLFLYMPRTQTIVYLTETAYRNYQSWELSKLLTIHMLQFRRQVHDYLGGETRPAAVMGSNIHGHFFWTSLTGLQYAFESGLFPHLAELVQLSRIYIDPQRVFPELADRPAPFFNDMPESFRHCVERKLLPIHFTDYQMNDAFGERIRRVAAANATEAGSPPPDAPRPLIWINLRGHTKIWINQAEGYSSILNAIYEEYGAVSVLLDGMRDCADLAEQIRARTRPEIPLYDGLKLNVYDTLNWAFAVDAYICPIGSALTITSAMANKPGVAHAETHHMQQMPWWHTVRTGLTMPLVPEMSQITDIGSDLYCNYDVDWRVLLELLRRVLRENYGEPPRQELRA